MVRVGVGWRGDGSSYLRWRVQWIGGYQEEGIGSGGGAGTEGGGVMRVCSRGGVRERRVSGGGGVAPPRPPVRWREGGASHVFRSGV